MELSPLENAIETMQNTNRELKNVVQEHMSNSPVALQPLSLKLNGIIDAAVMGGIAMYEKAFFSEEFRQAHLDDREKLVMLENLTVQSFPPSSLRSGGATDMFINGEPVDKIALQGR